MHPTDVVDSLWNILAFWDAFATSISLVHEIISCLLYEHTQLSQQCLSGKTNFQ